jgi:hypothetical protein
MVKVEEGIWFSLCSQQTLDRSLVMGKVIFYAITVAVIGLIICAIWPYWTRFVMKSELKEVAIYGTKHSIEETGNLLREKLKERGFDIHHDDFSIAKDEHNTVTINVRYHDEISCFGFILKELDFTLEVTEHEVAAVL